jgi:hypothetical protein
MSTKSNGSFAWVGFILSALCGAVPGLLTAGALMTSPYDGWVLLPLLTLVPSGVWAGTTLFDRYKFRGLTVALLWAVLAIIAFERFFSRD